MTVNYTPEEKKHEKTKTQCGNFVESKSLKCRARDHTSGDEITKIQIIHSHPSDPAKIKSLNFSNLKQLSIDEGSSTRAVVTKKFAKTLNLQFIVYYRASILKLFKDY